MILIRAFSAFRKEIIPTSLLFTKIRLHEIEFLQIFWSWRTKCEQSEHQGRAAAEPAKLAGVASMQRLPATTGTHL
jgi:hypothetical protein